MATRNTTTEEAPATAAADTPAAKPSKSKDSKGSVSVTVFVPAGPVPRDQIFKTAVTAVRDKIPVVYSLTHEIESVSEHKEVDGVSGRDYKVKISYETSIPGAEPVKIDDEIAKLTVPSLNDFNVATQVHDVPDNPK